MILVDKNISLAELRPMSEKMYGNIVKAVVDIDKEIMVIDVEMHVDAEQELLELGSEQKNLWGINIHPDSPKSERIEFDSMINIRPSQGNRTRSVENNDIQKKIVNIVNKLVIE